uniref:Uncharacterized protein n=1 Tax=Timema poppense TaxID=170557 RepID=A0A7R9H3F3_TIMPO|nr:unnamed protein product [Timema poppensis]
MEQNLIYAFRGWIAFVAFMDLGTAIRCFIEKKSFLGDYYQKTLEIQFDEPLLPRILGIFSILKALALIHCTLYIHYKPVVSLGVCSLIISLIMYTSEVLIYKSTTLSFYIIFPSVLNALTLFGLLALPRRLLENVPVTEDENIELLRRVGPKRRRNKKID